MSAAPGFHFSCTRCGNCCRVGHGRVWLGPGDVEAMALELGVSALAFQRDKVVTVDGRASLRQRSDGGCILLEGQAECTVYVSRPRQCREFPDWPQLEAPDALASAAGYCPGIQLFPDLETAVRVLPQVRGVIERTGGFAAATVPTRWATSLEVDFYLSTAEELAPAESEPALAALQQLAEEEGYPWSYGPWPRLLADRKAGWRARGGIPRPQNP